MPAKMRRTSAAWVVGSKVSRMTCSSLCRGRCWPTIPFISVPCTAVAPSTWPTPLQVGVAACRGVGKCRTGSGQGIDVVGQERPAYFDRSTSVDVVGGDDAPSTASRDPRLRYQFVNEVVDAARVELLGRVDNLPVPLVRCRAKENVDVTVTPGFEDTQRRVGENATCLRVIVVQG